MSIYILSALPSDASDPKAAPTERLLYSWFGGCRSPQTFFKVWFQPAYGFHVEMTSCELPEPCRYHNADDPVYKDSCLEFFVDFFPEMHKGYINFEINAAGAMLCMFGKSRENRLYVSAITDQRPAVKTVFAEDHWTAALFIPLSFINDIYGSKDFKPGQRLRGNVYKCGDETSRPHWGSWNWLGEDPIDFHQPETFGDFILES